MWSEYVRFGDELVIPYDSKIIEHRNTGTDLRRGNQRASRNYPELEQLRRIANWPAEVRLTSQAMAAIQRWLEAKIVFDFVKDRLEEARANWNTQAASMIAEMLVL